MSSKGSFIEPTTASVDTHTMGSSLIKYLNMKVHPVIKDPSKHWKHIKIVGQHLRDLPASVSSIEKRDKPFNWQRPTTSVQDLHTLVVHCFPGRDYVHHYASIVSTYLDLQGRDASVVEMIIPSPEQCLNAILQSNLRELGHVGVVIMGYVHGLAAARTGEWTAGDYDDQLFAWKIKVLPNGTRVAFLGCRVSFWGDISGNVVRALKDLNGAKCVLYIGKLGSLREEHVPNRFLAVGDNSLVHGQYVKWDTEWLTKLLSGYGDVKHGRHYTLGSVLDETKMWFEEQHQHGDWVDPEIGHMAAASLEVGVKFAYLHIISDNLAKHYSHDLSNEREVEVVDSRTKVLRLIDEIIEKIFEHWDLELRK